MLVLIMGSICDERERKILFFILSFDVLFDWFNYMTYSFLKNLSLLPKVAQPGKGTARIPTKLIPEPLWI